MVLLVGIVSLVLGCIVTEMCIMKKSRKKGIVVGNFWSNSISLVTSFVIYRVLNAFISLLGFSYILTTVG